MVVEVTCFQMTAGVSFTSGIIVQAGPKNSGREEEKKSFVYTLNSERDL